HIKRFAQFIAVCRSHLPDEQGHIVAPLGDDHQVACPKDFLGLLRHLHSHGTLLSQARATWERAYQLHARPQRTGDPKLRPPRKLSFWTFCPANGAIDITLPSGLIERYTLAAGRCWYGRTIRP